MHPTQLGLLEWNNKNQRLEDEKKTREACEAKRLQVLCDQATSMLVAKHKSELKDSIYHCDASQVDACRC